MRRAPLIGRSTKRLMNLNKGVIGLHVGQIAVKYGLDVEDQLVTVLPAEPDWRSQAEREFPSMPIAGYSLTRANGVVPLLTLF